MKRDDAAYPVQFRSGTEECPALVKHRFVTQVSRGELIRGDCYATRNAFPRDQESDLIVMIKMLPC